MNDRNAFSRPAADVGLTEYWLNRDVIEDPAHRGRALPFAWSWEELYPRLAAAAHEVPMELAYRRALLFMNPGLRPKPYITSTLYGGCSWYNPGEIAEVHRHQPSASRFALAGDGGYTTVEGEKCSMRRGDLILTPNGTWHDHGNEGSEPVIWIDLLDLPIVAAFNASFTMEYEYRERNTVRKHQSITKAKDYSVSLYGRGGLKAKFTSHQRGQGHGSPMFVYRWHDTLEALEAMKDMEPDACDGIALEYVDPTTGGAVLPTMSFSVHCHRRASRPRWKRTTASTVFCVIEGRGATEMEGASMSWAKNDLFVVPSGTWYRNVNADPGADLLLYAVSDEPALDKLGLLVVEERP